MSLFKLTHYATNLSRNASPTSMQPLPAPDESPWITAPVIAMMETGCLLFLPERML
jgi:hypothetical protein